jgi:hypothetical protein
MLEHDLGKALELHGAFGGILAHALAPIALDQALDGIEQIRPDGLRAEVAAPDAASQRIHQKQRDRSDDQQPGEIIDFLRPQLDEEEIETAVGKIDQHRLTGRTQTAIPAHEGQEVIDPEAERHQAPFDTAEGSGDALRIDFLVGHIERPVVFRLLQVGWVHGFVHRWRSLPWD